MNKLELISNPQAGDLVYSPEFGNGIVSYISDASTYKVTVEFDDDLEETFTLDGRMYEPYNPTLFKGHWKKVICMGTPVKRDGSFIF